jgi:CubicO group peptidase (beta-lactamase class C family)
MNRNYIPTAALALLVLPGFGGESRSLPMARPAPAGFSAERLERLHKTTETFVDKEKHAGIVTLLARDGKIVDVKTFGYRDLEKKLPMERDTICRVYSMSKIVTSVAVLMLLEEGKFTLDDPVTNYLPELKNMKVFVGGTTESPSVTDLQRPITIKHLLTHTSGLIYDFAGNDPLTLIYRKAELWSGPDLKNFIEKVGKLPLKHQPGDAFTYGINTDVLGRLVEVTSGKTFADFLQERLFRPLGMHDTSFDVPEEKRRRLAKTYEHASGSSFQEAKPLIETWPEEGRGVASGGAGLFSTVDDYALFAQMLLNQGQYNGIRILGRKTVELMTANHLLTLKEPIAFNPAHGFGLGVEVQRDLGHGAQLGSPGAFGWYGAATTYCRIDPKERIVAIAFAQHFPFNEHKFFEKFANGYYQAIVD